MIVGIGIDIVDLADFEPRLARDSFLNLFSSREIAYADSLPLRRAEILAARFAAKEAFVKALGAGLRAEWPLRELEVLHDEDGRPQLALDGPFAALLPPGSHVHVSLSHTRTSAAAVIVIET